MNSDVKKRWLEALRSGDYPQAEGALRNGDGFCCLGVLCDLHSEEHKDRRGWGTPNNNDEVGYLGAGAYLPMEVVRWAGLGTNDPLYDDEDRGSLVSLSSMNDAGSTFEEIANVIEEHL